MDKKDQVTITKSDLVEMVFSKIGFSKKEAAELVELVFESLKEAVCHQGGIKISKFGHFIMKEKKERIGRNPQTGEQMSISARRVLSFKPSAILKSQINSEDLSLNDSLL